MSSYINASTKKPIFAVVAGATGRTGQFLVRDLLALGYKVRLISRSRENVKKVLGDELFS
jgi:short-subunit dehydrogenase